jgi:hypothetical protein
MPKPSLDYLYTRSRKEPYKRKFIDFRTLCDNLGQDDLLIHSVTLCHTFGMQR